MQRIFYLFSFLLISLSASLNPGIKITLLPSQVENMKNNLFPFFHSQILQAPIRDFTRGNYKISNASIQNFNLSASDVILSQQEGSISALIKVNALDLIADIDRDGEHFANTTFTSKDDVLYLNLKPFLGKKNRLYYYVSNITLTLNSMRIRSPNFRLRGLADRGLFVAFQSLILSHFQRQLNRNLRILGSNHQRVLRLPESFLSLRTQNVKLPFIDAGRITYFLDGSFFVAGNSSASLPISTFPFPDWNANHTQGYQLLIADDVLNSALYALWLNNDFSINIGDVAQNNQADDTSNQNTQQTEAAHQNQVKLEPVQNANDNNAQAQQNLDSAANDTNAASDNNPKYKIDVNTTTIRRKTIINLKDAKIVGNSTLILQTKRLSKLENQNNAQNNQQKNDQQANQQQGNSHLEALSQIAGNSNQTESGTVNNLEQNFQGTEAQNLEAAQNQNASDENIASDAQNQSNLPGASYLLTPTDQLTTDLFDLVVPGLNSTFGPNKPVALHCFYNSDAPPTIQSINGSTTGLWDGTCQVWVNNGTGWVQAIVINGQANANATIQVIDGQNLEYAFEFLHVQNVTTEQSIIGNVDDKQLQDNLNFFLLWPTNLRNSVTLPLEQDANWKNPQIFIRDGYVELLADLDYAS